MSIESPQAKSGQVNRAGALTSIAAWMCRVWETFVGIDDWVVASMSLCTT